MVFQNLIHRFFIVRSQFWRANRLVFISPAEIRFIEIMGGKVITFDWVKHHRTNFALGIVITLGKILKREHIEREVRIGKYYVDFGVANKYYKRAIEIDGRNFHRDIVKEQERDDYCAGFGWSILHIQATDLWQQPDIIQRQVLKFLSK